MHDEHALVSRLADRLPELVSYVVSFAVLGGLWVRHHGFFRSLARIDTPLTWLNLVYLALVAFLPYPTRILGRYGDEPAATALYATTIVLIAAAAITERVHADRARLLGPDAEPWSLAPALAVPLVFLVSIPVGFAAGGRTAQWTWAALLLVGLARRRRRGR